MTAIEDREQATLIDLSHAVSSAEALRQLEWYLQNDSYGLSPGNRVDLHTGDLLLSPGVLAKMKLHLKRLGVQIDTLYSAVPQTQQSALDEGLFVRRQPLEKRSPTFRPAGREQTAYRFSAALEASSPADTLDLPFEQGRAVSKRPPAPVTSPSKQGRPTASPAEPVPTLSITLEDGTREAIETVQDLSTQTVYYRQTLRSGQVLEASGNIVVVGDAHSGSEVLADGDILVWGFLGGVAHAGRKGNTRAQIRAIRIEAVQLRIADQIARRPDRLFKQPGVTRGPEVAKIKDGEIQIFEDIFMER